MEKDNKAQSSDDDEFEDAQGGDLSSPEPKNDGQKEGDEPKEEEHILESPGNQDPPEGKSYDDNCLIHVWTLENED